MMNIPIFLSSDNNYAPFVATTIASACDNTKNFCEFYVLDGGITEENKSKIGKLCESFSNFSLEFIKVDVDSFFKDFKENMHFTKSMYSRFLIPELKPQVKKAIYSDVDVIVLGDISQMFAEDLEGYALGAVWEEMSEKRRNVKAKQILGLPDSHKYFSSGNLLIDCEQWRENNIGEKLRNLHNILGDKLQMPDQDVLNSFFADNYKLLNCRYCFLTAYQDYYPNTDIIIRHFEGLLKPWNVHPNNTDIELPHVQDFWHYAKLTTFYDELLEKTLDAKLVSKMKRYSILQKMLVKK